MNRAVVTMKVSEHDSHFYAWDDMTYVLGHCVIQREVIADALSWRLHQADARNLSLEAGK